MALVSCPECAGQISRSAITRPKCGFGLRKATTEPEQITNLAALETLLGTVAIAFLWIVVFALTDSFVVSSAIAALALGGLLHLTTRSK